MDMTTSYAGPTASMYLADLGADVIKVERPGTGDDARSWGPPFIGADSAWFASANRNKRSVVINLRAPSGPATLRTLVGQADVFMENFNPGKLKALQIDHESLRTEFPRLIYCAMSGYGLDGPDHTLPGYDLAAQARSGLMSVTGAKGGSPQRVSTALTDIVTGMCAALAINAAVVRQRAEGVGDLIDVSLLDSSLAVMAPRVAAHLAGEPDPSPSGGTDSVLAVYQSFPTADRDLVIAIGNDAMWRRFCVAIGLRELAERSELADNAGRRAHREQLIDLVTGRLTQRTAAEWQCVLGNAGIPCSLVQRVSEVVADPQVVAREALLPVPGTSARTVRGPFRLASMPRPRNSRFPELGAHTAEVLAEHGFGPDDIARLVECGVVEVGGARESAVR
ncbi:Crotonobetainyl-CoA:carnitine CoA-transferase CaiB [Actinomadura mexicana]|uniref:Crotonobetainyl-CoA:carnitine CoA-transferase CaiB n=1 Tax=Actinomadura mexicana TaxID=134959 RepID=A0A238XDD4_9ACTN|nr:Crotonobetainyl-CoA:carnitine CoA-transferase CaiB [Actinomadura mexicana]